MLSCLYVLLISYNLLKPFIPITGTFRPNESPFANDNDDRIFVNDPGPIETAINFAKSYKLNVEIVSIPEEKKSNEEVEKILFKTKEKFLKNNIKASTKLIDGSPVNSIVNYAKDDSIVILGVSPKNPIMKYFFGSKPLSIAQKCNCPVLITK